jgi:hypothetical protein
MLTKKYNIPSERIRKEDKLYIDKTEYIYRMTHSDGTYFFVGRPRRFGKSLLVSTMQSYFEGKKDLFKGLAMEQLEKEWIEYPVIHLDMSGGKYMSLYQTTGKKVVVLIDEYDAPLLDVAHEKEELVKLRNIMRNFFSPLKAREAYLRFVFFTGITKFSQVSIFSELNNVTNVSMYDEYAGMLGITKEELCGQLSEDIEVLATKMHLTKEQTLDKLTENYDGQRSYL